MKENLATARSTLVLSREPGSARFDTGMNGVVPYLKVGGVPSHRFCRGPENQTLNIQAATRQFNYYYYYYYATVQLYD